MGALRPRRGRQPQPSLSQGDLDDLGARGQPRCGEGMTVLVAALLATLLRSGPAAGDVPKSLLPVVKENLAAGRLTLMSTTVVASSLGWTESMADQGRSKEVVDPSWSSGPRKRDSGTLTSLASRRPSLPFLDDVTQALEDFRQHGARKVLAALIG